MIHHLAMLLRLCTTAFPVCFPSRGPAGPPKSAHLNNAVWNLSGPSWGCQRPWCSLSAIGTLSIGHRSAAPSVGVTPRTGRRLRKVLSPAATRSTRKWGYREIEYGRHAWVIATGRGAWMKTLRGRRRCYRRNLYEHPARRRFLACCVLETWLARNMEAAS